MNKSLSVKFEPVHLKNGQFTIITIYNKDGQEILHESLQKNWSDKHFLEKQYATLWCHSYFEKIKKENNEDKT